MKLYTAQMGRWREADKLGVPFIDVTVKSGNKAFAPTWDFLMEHKRGGSDQAYIGKFIPLMRNSYKNNYKEWQDLINLDTVCISCYCGKGKFCHRILLVDILEKVCNSHNIDFEYLGEL